MKALRYYGRADIRLDEIDEPEPGRGQVSIDVAAVGICGSDIHEYKCGPIAIPMTEAHRRPCAGRSRA